MRGKQRDLSDNGSKLVIEVEIRKIRTFFGTDHRYHRLAGTRHDERTLDREVSIPMPLIRFGRTDANVLKRIEI